MQFKIKEVADMHNISKKTLIHYDNIGLFKPNFIDDENGYRYYDIDQLPSLKHIIYLKKIGIKLEAIKELISEMDRDKYLELLQAKHDVLAKEIATKTKLKQEVEYLINLNNVAKYIDERDLYKPSIKIMDKREFAYKYDENITECSEIMLLYRSLLTNLDNIGAFSYREYGTIYRYDNSSKQVLPGAGTFIGIGTHSNKVDTVELEAGKYVSMYKQGGYFDKNSIDVLVKWIEDNDYEIVGDIYDFCIVDYTFVGDISMMIQELLVKVK